MTSPLSVVSRLPSGLEWRPCRLRQHMMKRSAIGATLSWAVWLSAGLFSAMPASAAIVLEVQQQGANVTIQGSGSANLAGLLSAGSSSSWNNILTNTDVYAGPAAFNDGSVSLWQGLTGPLSISANSIYEVPDDSGSTGDLFGILANNGSDVPRLVLPSGYVSGTALTGFSLYPSTDINTMGLTPGTFTWVWGSGATADSLQVRVREVPAPLPVAGASMAYSWAKTLRRRSRRSVGQVDAQP